MANIIEINDFSAPELDVYVRLTGAQLRSRLEPSKGIFIAESPTVIEVALQGGYTPLSLLTDKRLLGGEVEKLIRLLPEDTPVYTAQRDLLTKMTGFELTRGCLAAFTRRKPSDPVDILRSSRRVAVLEGIADSTNVGAIMRSAAALGIDGVLLTPTCCDPLCRRAIRVSMGTALLIPFATVGEDAEDWQTRGVELLRREGFRTCAMALRPGTIDISDPALKGEERLAIILGTEGTGLAEGTIDACDYTVKIPMFRQVDSLNVAAAAAIAFWELKKR